MSRARYVAAEHNPERSPLWPFIEPAEARACPTIVVDRRALKLLSRVQADLLRAVAGRRPTGPWGLSARPDAFLGSVRALTCLALCALWEARDAPDPLRRLRSDWSPGDERPVVVAGALGVVAAVLTSMVERPQPGIVWNPALLRENEPTDIDFDTLCWHLTANEADALRHLLPGTLAAYGHAFGAALASIAQRQVPNREEARRRAGFAGAARRRAAKQTAHAVERQRDREERLRQAAFRAQFAAMRRWDVFRRVRPLNAADEVALDCLGSGRLFLGSAGSSRSGRLS